MAPKTEGMAQFMQGRGPDACLALGRIHHHQHMRFQSPLASAIDVAGRQGGPAMAGPLPAIALQQGWTPMRHQHLGLVRIHDLLNRQDPLPMAEGRLNRRLPAPFPGAGLDPDAPMG